MDVCYEQDNAAIVTVLCCLLRPIVNSFATAEAQRRETAAVCRVAGRAAGGAGRQRAPLGERWACGWFAILRLHAHGGGVLTTMPSRLPSLGEPLRLNAITGKRLPKTYTAAA